MSTAPLIKKLNGAKRPEDVFGDLGSNGDRESVLRARYRKMAVALHPDRNPGNAAAAEAMSLLTAFHAAAEKRIAAGTYGTKEPDGGTQIRIGRLYQNVRPMCAGEISDVYLGDYLDGGSTRQAVIKVVRDPRDADLADAEIKTLRKLWKAKGADRFLRYLPEPIEAGKVSIGGKVRRVNVLGHADGLVSLAEVIAAHPRGLDPRDAAWMWRRVLEALSFVHRQEVVHGAINPAHVLIRPSDHGAVLLDWSYAVERGRPLLAISGEYEDLYPSEVRAKRPAQPALDIYMAACLHALLLGPRWRKSPAPIVRLLDACMLAPHQRYQSVPEVYKAFDDILRALSGPPAFRPFAMPVRKEN